MILVPADTPGITIVRPLTVFGYDDAPHGHMRDRASRTCACRVGNILLGEGRGFEIAQGRLGPGRIHHCMRLIGLAERALELMCKRARCSASRSARPIAAAGRDAGAHRRGALHDRQARLLTLKAACMMDTVGNKVAQGRDRDDQGGGAEHGLPGDRLGDAGARRRRRLRRLPARVCCTRGARTLRFADGPDEVHRNAIAKLELARYSDAGVAARMEPPVARG